MKKQINKLQPIESNPKGPSNSYSANPSNSASWDSSTPLNKEIRSEYNALFDSYCPFIHTKQFQSHYKKQLKLEKLTKEQKSKSLLIDFNTSLDTQLQPSSSSSSSDRRNHNRNNQTNSNNNNNQRPNSAPENNLQTNLIPSSTSIYSNSLLSNHKKITISIEPSGNILESETELEVLKTILTREGYLLRLIKLIKTIEKKFKPEIADLLDLLRISSINVIEAIIAWRTTKVSFYFFYF